MKYLDTPGNEKKIKNRANQFDTIRVMKGVAYESALNPIFKNLINKYDLLRDPDRIKKIFDFCFYNTFYEKDDPRKQTVRSGIRSLTDKKANCVDYSVLLSSFLLNLNEPHFFRMVSTDENRPNDYNHIYVILGDGTPLDLVIGQDQNGKEILKRAKERTNFFGIEVPFIKKKDVKIL